MHRPRRTVSLNEEEKRKHCHPSLRRRKCKLGRRNIKNVPFTVGPFLLRSPTSPLPVRMRMVIMIMIMGILAILIAAMIDE